MSVQILRFPAVQARQNLSRSTLRLRIAARLFTKPVSLGGRSVGWPEHEVDVLTQARIAGMCDDEIRTLVAKLEAARTSGELVEPPAAKAA
jgi:prophage regulatory protein